VVVPPVVVVVCIALVVDAWRTVVAVRQRKRAEAARAFLESILNKIADPVFVKDRAHRLILVNDAECQLSGHDREELVDKTDYDFFPKDQVDIFWQQDDLVFETGAENVNEETITDADGIVRTIVTKKTRYVDRVGNRYVVGVIRDITDRKHAEDEVRKVNLELERRVAQRTADLEREKERLAVTLRSIGDGVIATDTDGRVQLMNSAAEMITGWPLEQAVGKSIEDVLRLNDGEPGGAGDSVRAEPSPEDRKYLIARDGNVRLVAMDVAPIRGSGGSTLGQVRVFSDITDQQRLEEKLANAQRIESIGVLAAGIAHDFNNLLTGVFGHLELARATLASDAQATRHLSQALNAWQRAKDLTQQLLTFSKGGTPVKKPTNVGALIERTTRFVLSGSAITHEIRVSPNLAYCEIDEGQIGQVIDNVVINAAQAMGHGGHLSVEARNVDVRVNIHGTVQVRRHVEITVRDTGPGIPRDVVGKVFDPFFSTKPDGSGLGLTIAYSVVARHDGQIAVESEPERGTTVKVLLPACDTARVEPTRPHATPHPSAARILIIDDEQAVRSALTGLLSLRGHSVTTARSSREGVDHYEKARKAGTPFDLVIVDLTIPGEPGGTETLERLRGIDPRVQAVATSGYSESPVMADPKRFGFAHTLPKPFTLADIDAVLGVVLPTG
jgi:PAS domain S-box-containing protein